MLMILTSLKGPYKKRRYKIQCARHASGIAFIRYAKNRNIGNPNNLKRSLLTMNKYKITEHKILQ